MEKPHKKKPIQYDFYFGASPELIQRARSLRSNETEPEKHVWSKLKIKDLFPIRWRRQHPAHKFILDFYCPGVKLAIEIDGDSHLGLNDKFYDEDRDEIMAEFGVKTIRFTNDEVINELDKVEFKIKEEVQNREGIFNAKIKK